MKKTETSMEEIDRRLAEIKARINTDNLTREELPIPKKKWWMSKKKTPIVTAKPFVPPRDPITNIKDRFRHEKSWLIHMELRQGGKTSFIINTAAMEFEYAKGRYVIDSSMAIHNHGVGMFELEYNQDFCLPIRKRTNLKDLKDAIEVYGQQVDLEVENNTNPMELKRWEEGKIAEQAFEGSSVDDQMRMQRLLLWILIVINVLILIIVVKASGILKSVKIPGLG